MFQSEKQVQSAFCWKILMAWLWPIPYFVTHDFVIYNRARRFKWIAFFAAADTLDQLIWQHFVQLMKTILNIAGI